MLVSATASVYIAPSCGFVCASLVINFVGLNGRRQRQLERRERRARERRARGREREREATGGKSARVSDDAGEKGDESERERGQKSDAKVSGGIFPRQQRHRWVRKRGEIAVHDAARVHRERVGCGGSDRDAAGDRHRGGGGVGVAIREPHWAQGARAVGRRAVRGF